MATANLSLSDKPGIPDRGFFFILIALLAGLFYTGFFFLWKSELIQLFQEDYIKLISEAQNQGVKDFFEKYALYGWIAFSLLLIIKSILLFGLKKILGLQKKYFLNPFLYFLLYGWFTIFAWQIYYHEPHYSAIWIAIIYLVAKPMLYSSISIFFLIFLRFVFSFFKQKPKNISL